MSGRCFRLDLKRLDYRKDQSTVMATPQQLSRANGQCTSVMRIVYRIGIYIFLTGLFLQLLFAGFGVFLGWWGHMLALAVHLA